MSVLSFSFSSISLFLGLQNRSSAALCLFFEICWTSKSNSYIHTIHCVIRASERSDAEWFNYVINIFAFNLITKWTLYKYCCIFLSPFNSPLHSLLSVLYFFSFLNYRPLKNLNKCLFLSAFNWSRWAPHPLRLISKAKIILSALLSYYKDIKADTVVNTFFNVFIVFFWTISHLKGTSFLNR